MTTFSIFVLLIYLYWINPWMWIKINKIGIFLILTAKEHVIKKKRDEITYKVLNHTAIKTIIRF